jgi:hypothetical protein
MQTLGPTNTRPPIFLKIKHAAQPRTEGAATFRSLNSRQSPRAALAAGIQKFRT